MAMNTIDFPNYFADAEADFSNADFVIYGVGYQRCPSFRYGVDKASSEIRKASWNFETYDLHTGVDISTIKIHDYGDVDVLKCTDSEMIERVKQFNVSLLKKQKFPIVMGGNHAITSAIITSYPKDIAVLILDAHMDYRQQYEDSKYNHACVLRRCVDHVGTENVAMLGVRSAEHDEFKQATSDNIFFIDSFFIKKNGISKSIQQTQQYLKGKKIYLSIDSDVFDPSIAPATGTPEPYGLTDFEVLEIIKAFSKDLVGFDIVEICPGFDYGQTCLLAAKIIRQVIGLVSLNQKKS